MISFREFLAAAAGGGAVTPYPWQERLAARLASGKAPRAIVVPTGGGKTVTIEALLWALAVQADRAPHERTIGVRTVWAIDRRILVDDVHARATKLAQRLSTALSDPGDDLHEMALRLQSLPGPRAEPLRVTRWRGGLARESRAHHPLQPEVITSTVAQIGSRLLFRGYGVGERSLALEAGLAAVDTTICLDEAHLAEPFRQTVDAIRAIRGHETTALPGLRAITLTATPTISLPDTDVHGINNDDRAALGTRLTGEKVARLAEPASDRAADQLAALLDAVEEHLDAGASTIACVVNSVRTAIEAEAGICRRRPDVVRALLIGPQRPVDRNQLLKRHREQLFHRAAAETPLVCVATQTFEVGLDADVDALVTQSASASAIVQRLGRLNRAGVRHGRATIVRDTQSPLYDEDEPLAWHWLRSLQRSDGTIDVSVTALMEDDGRPAPVRSPGAPELTTDVVELLVQTAPRPARMTDPDVEVFLRGAEKQPSSDVDVCWRCDLRIADDSDGGRSYRKALLRLVPPGRQEIVTVSIARTHALLRALRAPRTDLSAVGKSGLDTPDIEGGDDGAVAIDALAAGREDGDAPSRLVVLRGREQFEVTLDDSGTPDQDRRLRDIRPGDVLVLPTSAGGYANGALAPASRSIVDDVAADLRATTDATVSPAALRLSSEVLTNARLDAERILRRARRCDAAHGTGLDELCGLLGPAGEQLRALGTLELRRITDDPEPHLGDLDDDADELTHLDIDIDHDNAAGAEHAAVESNGAHGAAFVLLVRETTTHPEPLATRPEPVATREDLRPAGESPPTLDDHATAVAERAASFVSRSNLPRTVAAAIVLAARAHDHGKADPRFQAFFRGGIPAMAAPAIAKSVFGIADVQASRAARAAAGLPAGLRHEIASVAALADAVENARVIDMPDHVDIELALHLVATHHGLGRPIPRVPSPSASAPREFAVNAAGIAASPRGDAVEGWDRGAWLRRFLAIVARYGPWGSAYLEALLILSDRTVSQEGG